MMDKNLKSRYLRCRPIERLSGIDKIRIENDLTRYLELAKELGATEAKVITKENLYLDKRVGLKCAVPRCTTYGKCANCPPYTWDPNIMEGLIEKYMYGIFLRWEYEKGLTRKEGTALRKKVFEAVSKLEAAAFYDGYYFACGFATGSCKRALCNGATCQELLNPHQGCRFPLLARPSMEAVGFDVYQMAATVGWKIYPAGSNCPEEVPSLSRMALVLIN